MIETEYVFSTGHSRPSTRTPEASESGKEMLITQTHILKIFQKLLNSENQKLILNIQATFLKGILL